MHNLVHTMELSMKYFVTFQQMGKHGRPIDHPSAADFEADGAAALPNVGDYVQILAFGHEGAPQYSGKVRSRLFRYLGADNCGVNIVIEDADDDDWGALIKE